MSVLSCLVFSLWEKKKKKQKQNRENSFVMFDLFCLVNWVRNTYATLWYIKWNQSSRISWLIRRIIRKSTFREKNLLKISTFQNQNYSHHLKRRWIPFDNQLIITKQNLFLRLNQQHLSQIRRQYRRLLLIRLQSIY